MKLSFTKRMPRWLWALCLLIVVNSRAAAQYVDVTAEFEINNWASWFFADENGGPSMRGAPRDNIFATSAPIRCVIGTNLWMIETDFALRDSRVTRWFTGSNIVERVVRIAPLSEAELKRRTGIPALATFPVPAVGDELTRVHPSADGNPGRPVGVVDLFYDSGSMAAWLAFCSGPALKRDGRHIPPPSPFWKQYFSRGFVDNTSCFDDALALPKSIELTTALGQVVFQYRVRQTTNMLGWNIPTEFYFVQYRRARPPLTNANVVQLTGKGRVTALSITNSMTASKAPHAK